MSSHLIVVIIKHIRITNSCTNILENQIKIAHLGLLSCIQLNVMSLLVAVAITNAIGRELAHSTSPLTPVANVECYPKPISICLQPTRTRTGAIPISCSNTSFLSCRILWYVTWHHLSCVYLLVAHQMLIFYYYMKLLTICWDRMKNLIYEQEGFSNCFVTVQDPICWISCVVVFKFKYSVIYGMFHFCEK